MNKNNPLKCPPAPFPKYSFIGIVSTVILLWLILWHQNEALNSNLSSAMGNYSKFFVWPSFEVDVIEQIAWAFLETIEVALVGTVLGAVIALPLSLLASDMGGSPMVTRMVRAFLAFIRSIPLLFYGFIIVKFCGLGVVSGVVAVMIYSLGILSKQFFDEIANLDETVAHSIMSTGANRFQVFWYGLLPELLPNFMAFSLLRFEINIREASILGMVGAGGIGVLLVQWGQLPPYNKLWSLILFFFVVVVLIEVFCRWTIKVTK